MKYFIAASLVILSLNVILAQTKLGLKVSPAVIHHRIQHTDDTASISSGANPFNVAIALFADFPLSQNYFFTTGVGYTSKRVSLTRQWPADVAAEKKRYNIQYVRVPLTLKLYTNEIALDKKLYFQAGPIVDVAVHQKEHSSDAEIIDEFQPVDVGLLFATGLQIQLGPQTAIQIGCSYTRGLINIVKTPAPGISNQTIKNDLYAIDLAVKF